ncbi:MAG TPA: extracellular solute-binding protein, partial [Pseudolysinimonas sp.]|nr:extracellular solute-binding protein [Pseudolysinimonas sp.]
ITFQTWWAYANQSLVDGFKAKYPKVNVKLQFVPPAQTYATKLQTEASSNTLPDVFAAQGAPLVALAHAKQLYNLNDALATKPYDETASTWKASFVGSLLDGSNASMAPDETNGETYGVPFNAISVAVVYNKDAYAKAGVTPPKDFAGLLSNCKALKAAGYIPMSLTGANWGTWWPSLAMDQTMRGEKVANFSTSDPNYVKAYATVKEMADAGCWSSSQITTDIAAETSLFLQQKTASFVTVPENFLQAVDAGAKFPLGSWQLPGIADNAVSPVHTLGGGNANVIVVNAHSKNLSAAVAFAKYLTSTEVETKLAKEDFTIPSINVNLSTSNPLMATWVKAAKDGFANNASFLPSLTPAGQTKWQTVIVPQLILGQLTPEQAAAATNGLYVTP